MTWFHALQLAVFAAGLLISCKQWLVRYRGAGLHAAECADVFAVVADEADRNACEKLVRALPDCGVTRLAQHALTPDPDAPTLQEDLRAQQFSGVSALRSLARMALPLAFLGGILELSAAFGGGEGLVALQKGLAEHIALQGALLSFALGVGTSLYCAAAAVLFHQRGRQQAAGLDAIVQTLGTRRIDRKAP